MFSGFVRVIHAVSGLPHIHVMWAIPLGQNTRWHSGRIILLAPAPATVESSAGGSGRQGKVGELWAGGCWWNRNGSVILWCKTWKNDVSINTDEWKFLHQSCKLSLQNAWSTENWLQNVLFIYWFIIRTSKTHDKLHKCTCQPGQAGKAHTHAPVHH